MPIISVFFGIVIRMYHDDHAPPHFHASYQGQTAFVRIADGMIHAGNLPKKAAAIVRRWALDPSGRTYGKLAARLDLEPMHLIPGADVDD